MRNVRHYGMCLRILVLLAVINSAPPSAFAGSVRKNCNLILRAMSEAGSDSIRAYVNLLKLLVKDKNALPASHAAALLDQPAAVNPFELLDVDLPREQAHAFENAFSKILREKEISAAEWEQAKSEIRKIIDEKAANESKRGEVQEKTAGIFFPIAVDRPKQVMPLEYTSGFQSKDGSVFLVQDKGGWAPYAKTSLQIDKVGDQHAHYYNGSTAGRYFHFEFDDGTIAAAALTPAGIEVTDFPGNKIFSATRFAFFGDSSEKTVEHSRLFMFKNAKGEHELVAATYDPRGSSTTRFIRKNIATGETAEQLMPMGFYAVQQLSDGRIVAIVAGRDKNEREFLVKEIGGARTGIFRTSIPPDLGDYPRSKVLETKDGRKFFAVLDRGAGYIFDMVTGKPMKIEIGFSTFPEFEKFVEDKNGEMVLVARDDRSITVIVADFERQTVDRHWIPFWVPNRREFITLENGTSYVITVESKANDDKRTLAVYELESGVQVASLNIVKFNLGQYLFTGETADHRIVSYFLKGGTLVPLQIFGPPLSQ